jgi:hypothetical protein
MCGDSTRDIVETMQELLTDQPTPMAYIACDLADDETLADFRKRTGTSRRRWWQVGQR